MDHAGRENWWLWGTSNSSDQLQHYGSPVCVLSSLSALPLENPKEEVAQERCALLT